MKTIGSKILFFAVVLLWIACTSFSFAAGNIDVKVEAGFDGSIKIYNSNQFKFILTSKENFSGQLVMTLNKQTTEKFEYAVNIDLPAGSKKEYVMNVPIYTIDKKIDYKILQGNREISTGKFELKKIVPPNVFSIGVLCEDKNAFSEYSIIKNEDFINYMQMNDMKVSMSSAMMTKSMYSSYKTMPPQYGMQGGYYGGPVSLDPAQADEKIEIIKLEKSNFPDNLNSLNSLNMIIIDNFDTSKLDKAQLETLDAWTSKNRILMICNGSQFIKVNAGLPEDMRLFKPAQSKGIPFPASMKKFGDFNDLTQLNIAIGKYEKSTTILTDADVPLVSIQNYKDGQIINTAFSMFENPYNVWNGRIELIKFILKSTMELPKTMESPNADASGSGIDTRGMLSQTSLSIPDDQLPPITTIIIILSVYLLIVSPFLYFILKIKDKKELSWILIPVISLVFVGIIYVIGYKSRFTKVVSNNASVIEISPETKTEKISSNITLFNNKNGTLKIQYPKDFPLELDNNQGMNYQMGMPQMVMPQIDTNQIQYTTTGKILFGDEITYEAYNANLWSPRTLFTSKIQKNEGSIMIKSSINDNKIDFKIKNDSVYSLKDAYILFASNIFEAGEIKAGSEKQLSLQINSSNSSNMDPVNFFIEEKFGQKAMSKLIEPKLIREANRKRNILQGLFMNVLGYNNGLISNKRSAITLVAFNDTPIKFPIKANDDVTDTYTTNIIIQNIDIQFEKGQKFYLPSGLINPSIIAEGEIGIGVEQNRMINFFTDGVVQLNYELIPKLNIDNIKINLDKFKTSVKNSSVLYLPNGSTSTRTDTKVDLSIQNFRTGKWETISENFETKMNSKDYIKDNKINMKISVVVSKEKEKGQYLISIPEVELSGVSE